MDAETVAKGPTMSELTDELRALMAKATAGRLDTAERKIEEWVECPVCQGDGEVNSVDYCNIDEKAIGVLFYGIGDEHCVHEKLWSAAVNALPALLDKSDADDARIAELEAEVERLRGQVESWTDANRDGFYA